MRLVSSSSANGAGTAPESLGFLTPVAAIPAVSPLDNTLEAAGAQFEVRHGWRVATGFGDAAGEARALTETVGWSDSSHLGKFELHAPGDEPSRGARRVGLEWWCPVTAERGLVLSDPARTATVRAELEQRAGGRVIDVTTQFGALVVAGPAARETIARFCALDLRAAVSPPGSFRPGSVASTPGAVLVEAPDRFLLLFGAAVASYVWTVVADAGSHLGGCPVGADALRVAGLSAGLEVPVHA